MWDARRPEKYAKEGVFTVNGRLEGTQLTTKLHVRVYLLKQQGANISDTNGPVQNCHVTLLQTQIQATQFQMLMTSSFPTIQHQPIGTNWNRTNPEASVGVLYSEIQVF